MTSSRPRVVVIGLGPGGPDLVTTGTRATLARSAVRFVRTWRHPSASVVRDEPGPAGATMRIESFDALYERADRLDDVYAGIVDALAAAAVEHGEVCYAVPGSPAVAERTVVLLRDDPRVDVVVEPALSFLDLAWVRLGVDPVALGVSVVDGHRFLTEAAGRSGPLLVAQCDDRDVLSTIKLALDEWPDEQPVVLARLGLPDESVRRVAWEDLDRDVEPDHLTSLYLPPVGRSVGASFARFDELVRALREGCPWDREQTHESLRRHLIEESYEVLDALDALRDAVAAGDPAPGYEHLEEELGDLLFQVFFHATLAAEEGWFTVADVADRVHDKLRARHPHVFGDVVAETADDVLATWEQLKKAEKGRASVMEGIPSALPSLLYALKVQKKAAGEGYLEPDVAEPAAALRDLLAGLDATDAGSDEATVGRLLFAAVALARRSGADPEDVLRQAALGYRDRFDARPAPPG